MKNRTYHLSYGMVNLPSGRMKSREGTVVDADDLIAETTSLALEETKTRYVCLSVHGVLRRGYLGGQTYPRKRRSIGQK